MTAARIARKVARLPPEDRAAAILAAARLVLAEKGYEGFLATDVAARCRVSEATVYRYFPTKRDLVIKVAEAWFAEVLAVEPEIEQQQDTYQQLLHVVRYSLAVVRKESALTRFILQELRPDPAYRATVIYALNRRFTSTVSHVIKDGIAKGIFRQDIAPALVRDMIFGCIEHQTWAYLRGEGEFALEASAHHIADIVYQGLLAQPARDRALLAAALARIEGGAEMLSQEVRTLKDALARQSGGGH